MEIGRDTDGTLGTDKEGDIIMSRKEMEYLQYKKHLNSLNLTSKEYEQKLRDWCRKRKY